MKVDIEKTVTINNLYDWFKFASPKGEEKQWKKGRSALEIASYALSDDFKTMIKDLVKSIGLPCPQNFTCEPEALTSFPSDTMGTGGPRNHDLLMVSGNLIIGIEAKVSESFDETIENRKKGASKNLLKRIDGFCEYLYGLDNRPDNLDKLRYQLFSATVGTIIEAERRDVDNCIMLVIVFNGNVEKEKGFDQNVLTNEQDFKNFCNSLGLPDEGGMIQHGETRCWIKKISVTVK